MVFWEAVLAVCLEAAVYSDEIDRDRMFPEGHQFVSLIEERLAKIIYVSIGGSTLQNIY